MTVLQFHFDISHDVFVEIQCNEGREGSILLSQVDVTLQIEDCRRYIFSRNGQ